LAARRSASSVPTVQFFEGVKSCSNDLPPQLVCTIQTSNVPLLTGAQVAYISNPGFFSDPPTAPFLSTATGGSFDGRFDSDVVLTTTETTPSKAYGHCTFYDPTETGLCVYTHGTNSLAGFHATLVIGTLPDGTNSVIGKYWFDD
jgi:hypothetical protein